MNSFPRSGFTRTGEITIHNPLPNPDPALRPAPRSCSSLGPFDPSVSSLDPVCLPEAYLRETSDFLRSPVAKTRESIAAGSSFRIRFVPRGSLFQVGGQAVLGRQSAYATPWLTERHGYDPTCLTLFAFRRLTSAKRPISFAPR